MHHSIVSSGLKLLIKDYMSIYLAHVYVNGQFVETHLSFYHAADQIKKFKLEMPHWEYSIREEYVKSMKGV